MSINRFAPGISFDGLNPDFLGQKVKPFIASLPFDTITYSAYRSIEKQTAMYNDYLIKLDQFNRGVIRDRPSVVNRPGNSSHNWGFGLDIHPASFAAADYATMLAKSKSFGLKRDAIEIWHFQDDRLTFDIMAQWLKDNPASARGGALVLFAIILIALYFIFHKRINNFLSRGAL